MLEPITQRVAEVVSPGIPRGMDLLDTPLLNKGTAFSDTERTQFGLHGLLPPHVETLEEQVVRAYEAYARKQDDLERRLRTAYQLRGPDGSHTEQRRLRRRALGGRWSGTLTALRLSLGARHNG